MIELDNGPLAISLIIALAFVLPILYGFFIDRNEQEVITRLTHIKLV